MKHDENYRRLFSHRAMIEALFTHYVDPALQRGLLLEEATPQRAKFIDEDRLSGEADGVWKIPHVSGDDVYVCLLLEFQSSTRMRRPMAFQVLRYSMFIWETLLNSGVEAGRLPPVFPIVLYNGERVWDMATDMQGLMFKQVRKMYTEYCAQVRYVLLDISRLRARMLANRTDPVSLMMRVETAQTVEEFTDLLDVIVAHLGETESDELRRIGADMKVWLAHLAQEREYIDEASVQDIINTEEIDMSMTLLEASMERWKREREEQLEREVKKAREQAVEEGLKQGLEQGLEQGRRDALMRLMTQKFGPDAERAERIASLDGVQLERALMRLLTAETADEVFSA